VLSNIWDWEAVKLIELASRKSRTIERVSDVMKNGLAVGLPSEILTEPMPSAAVR